MIFMDALSYPIRRGGWMIILAGAVLSVLLHFLRIIPSVGMLVTVFSVGYFGSYYFDIISNTMTGHDAIPDWPGFSSVSDDIIWPFVRLCGLVLISFGPAVALFWFADQKAAWYLSTFLAAVGFGCFYFPMSVLAFLALGGLGAAMPHIVIPAVFRSGSGYLLAVVGLVTGYAVCGLVQTLTEKVPFVGWVFASLVAIYCLMFQGRLIGLIYREKSEELGWE